MDREQSPNSSPKAGVATEASARHRPRPCPPAICTVAHTHACHNRHTEGTLTKQLAHCRVGSGGVSQATAHALAQGAQELLSHIHSGVRAQEGGQRLGPVVQALWGDTESCSRSRCECRQALMQDTCALWSIMRCMYDCAATCKAPQCARWLLHLDGGSHVAQHIRADFRQGVTCQSTHTKRSVNSCYISFEAFEL